MHKYVLMRSRRNQALEEIKRHDLDPSDFEWTEVEEEPIPMVAGEGVVSVLVHRPSGYSFRFDLRNQRYSATFSPGRDAPTRHEICRNLAHLMALFVTEWLPSLKRETEAPDLWAELTRRTGLTEAVRTTDAAPFTPEEREQLTQGLAEIKVWLLKQADVQQQHADLVTDRLGYLEAGIDRLPRNDWIHTAIGVLFTLAVGVGLGPDQARDLFRVANDALTHVITGIAKLLQ